jgi:hypothetical protein
MEAATAAQKMPREVVLTEDEILSEWCKIMVEWGHFRTAKNLRTPTLAEARAAIDRQTR